MKIDPTRIAFDIDGVVADTMTLFLDIAREEYQVRGIQYTDITCYHLDRCLDMPADTLEAVAQKLVDGDYSQPLAANPGASEVLARIGQRHPPVLFVTARPYLGPIREWMEGVLPLAPEAIDIVATGHFEAKVNVLLNRGISVFVEDRLETCYILQKAGITPILFRQPWNRENTVFREIGSWSELAAMMELE